MRCFWIVEWTTLGLQGVPKMHERGALAVVAAKAKRMRIRKSSYIARNLILILILILNLILILILMKKKILMIMMVIRNLEYEKVWEEMKEMKEMMVVVYEYLWGGNNAIPDREHWY